MKVLDVCEAGARLAVAVRDVGPEADGHIALRHDGGLGPPAVLAKARNQRE